MSAYTINAARTRAEQLYAPGNVSNVKISPGYGVTYVQAGANRSARIPEIEVNDSDYVQTFQQVIDSFEVPVGGGNQGLPQQTVKRVTASASLSGSNILVWGIVIFVLGKWVFKWF